jgi:3-hydroxyacyl-CoA dehydrogenase/enoyl-CoA hydratase/3-hydroxybutyryl-CoA epimerase
MVGYHRNRDIGIIEFYDPDSKVNLLSQKNLDTLESIVDDIMAGDKRIKTLFFISKKHGVFIAGADIKELSAIKSREEALLFCKKGQDLFNKIESLEVPTFAIVNGVCVGGGLELALSCNYIIATENKKVKFGLPEVKLGIVPGFGGVHRLKARIGGKKADELISTGKLLNAREARRLNIVDRIISESEQFMYQELSRICRRSHHVKSQPELDRQERELLAEKILKRPAKNALSSFLLISKYKHNPSLEIDSNKISPIKCCTVIGAGTMGKGIAYLINTETDITVNLADVDKTVLRNAKLHIKNIYRDAVERGLVYRNEARSKFKNLSFCRGSLKDADIIIESVPEEASIKKSLFAEIEREVRKDSIIATNTSCISIEELSKPLRNAERFLGVHFFNPPYKMKLVEVVPTKFSSKRVSVTVIKFLRNLRRIPIIVKDSPGFLVNRMLLPYLNEAMFMVLEGIAPEDIESSMLEFGMPIGPLQLIKEIGSDVVYKGGKILEDSFGRRMKVPDIKQGLTSVFRPRLSLGQRDIINRLLHPIRREALLCLEEGIVDNREIIDLALLLGIGFPRTKRIWKTQDLLTR